MEYRLWPAPPRRMSRQADQRMQFSSFAHADSAQNNLSLRDKRKQSRIFIGDPWSAKLSYVCRHGPALSLPAPTPPAPLPRNWSRIPTSMVLPGERLAIVATAPIVSANAIKAPPCKAPPTAPQFVADRQFGNNALSGHFNKLDAEQRNQRALPRSLCLKQL